MIEGIPTTSDVPKPFYADEVWPTETSCVVSVTYAKSNKIDRAYLVVNNRHLSTISHSGVVVTHSQMRVFLNNMKILSEWVDRCLVLCQHLDDCAQHTFDMRILPDFIAELKKHLHISNLLLPAFDTRGEKSGFTFRMPRTGYSDGDFSIEVHDRAMVSAFGRMSMTARIPNTAVAPILVVLMQNMRCFLP